MRNIIFFLNFEYKKEHFYEFLTTKQFVNFSDFDNFCQNSNFKQLKKYCDCTNF